MRGSKASRVGCAALGRSAELHESRGRGWRGSGASNGESSEWFWFRLLLDIAAHLAIFVDFKQSV